MTRLKSSDSYFNEAENQRRGEHLGYLGLPHCNYPINWAEI